MSTTPPIIGLGPVKQYTPLSQDLSSDAVIASIKAACQGGPATTNYFNTVNSMGQLFQQLSEQGRNAWSDGTDTSPIAAPVKYVAAKADGGNEFYIKVEQTDVTQDDNGNINTNGSTRTINNVTYNGIGTITMECGWTNYTFSKTSWWVGTSIAGAVASKLILPPLFSAIKSVANVVADRIKSMASTGAGDDPAEDQDDEENENSTGDQDIVDEAGEDVIIEDVTEEGALALGDIFIGGAIVLAVVFIVLSFVLHNSYHYVRLWNLTEYDLDWTIHFDTSEPVDEGQLVKGPVVFNSNSTVQSFTTISAVSIGESPVPGVQATNSAQYADMNVNCSHDFSGIGYVLQYYLKKHSTTSPNPNPTVYTATMYFDIPFAGENSTDCTMDPTVTDLQGYYNQNSGNNKAVSASATSSDGAITVTTTYDYLSGEHPVPNQAQSGGDSNEQYYYQSIINIQQNNLGGNSSALLGLNKRIPPPSRAPLRKATILREVRPDIRKKILKQYFSKSKAQVNGHSNLAHRHNGHH